MRWLAAALVSPGLPGGTSWCGLRVPPRRHGPDQAALPTARSPTPVSGRSTGILPVEDGYAVCPAPSAFGSRPWLVLRCSVRPCGGRPGSRTSRVTRDQAPQTHAAPPVILHMRVRFCPFLRVPQARHTLAPDGNPGNGHPHKNPSPEGTAEPSHSKSDQTRIGCCSAVPTGTHFLLRFLFPGLPPGWILPCLRHSRKRDRGPLRHDPD